LTEQSDQVLPANGLEMNDSTRLVPFESLIRGSEAVEPPTLLEGAYSIAWVVFASDDAGLSISGRDGLFFDSFSKTLLGLSSIGDGCSPAFSTSCWGLLLFNRRSFPHCSL
jgi:hypothetical protein